MASNQIGELYQFVQKLHDYQILHERATCTGSVHSVDPQKILDFINIFNDTFVSGEFASSFGVHYYIELSNNSTEITIHCKQEHTPFCIELLRRWGASVSYCNKS